MKQFVLLAFAAVALLAAPKIVFDDFTPTATTPPVITHAPMLKQVRKTVVNIAIQKNVTAAFERHSPMFNDPFFRQFFDDRMFNIPKERVERSLGSGVIISGDGYIVTNNHVVENANRVVVNLAGSHDEYEAKVIGSDPKSDLAIIKIEASNLTAARFFDSDKVEVGDVVFAIGNPFGVGETITSGIVSATNRSSMGIVEYEDFIQTDAAINPGNSGGALVNSAGALVGINSAILTRSGASHGVGFSIPSNMVKLIATQLIENGKVVRAWLGVSIGDLEENLQEFYGKKEGAVVMGVEPKSPADKAGLKRGDLITRIDSKPIAGATQLRNTIAALTPKQTVKIEIVREKKTVVLNAALGANNDGAEAAVGESVGYKGLSVQPLNDEIRAKYSIGKEIQGVIVEKVAENSEAARARITVGDVIVQVESTEITSVDQFKKLTAGNNKKRLFVLRRGGIFVSVL